MKNETGDEILGYLTTYSTDSGDPYIKVKDLLVLLNKTQSDFISKKWLFEVLIRIMEKKK